MWSLPLTCSIGGGKQSCFAMMSSLVLWAYIHAKLDSGSWCIVHDAVVVLLAGRKGGGGGCVWKVLSLFHVLKELAFP